MSPTLKANTTELTNPFQQEGGKFSFLVFNRVFDAADAAHFPQLVACQVFDGLERAKFHAKQVLGPFEVPICLKKLEWLDRCDLHLAIGVGYTLLLTLRLLT